MALKNNNIELILDVRDETLDFLEYYGDIDLPFGEIIKYELMYNLTPTKENPTPERKKVPNNPKIDQELDPVPTSLVFFIYKKT